MKQLLEWIRHPSFRRLSSEAFWVAFGIFFSTLGTFVGVRLLTSILDPSEYGRLALAISCAMGVSYSVGTGLSAGIMRFYSVALLDGRAGWYWRSIRRILIVIGILFGMLVAVASIGLLLAGSGIDKILMWILALLFGGLLVVNASGDALQTGARNRKLFSLHQNLFGWGRFLVAYLFVVVWQGTAVVALTGFVAAALLVLASQIFWVKRKILAGWSKEESQKDSSKEFFHYVWPILVGGIFVWLQMFADRWALTLFRTLDEVGVYFALYQVSYAPMLYFSVFLINLLSPIFYGKIGDGADQDTFRQTLMINEKIAVCVLAALGVGVLGAAYAGEAICSVLIDQDYAFGFWAFPWILATGGIFSVAQQLVVSIYSGLNVRLIVPLRGLSALLACGCYFTGAFFFEFKGVVFGGLLFSMLFLGCVFAIAWMLARGKLKLER